MAATIKTRLRTASGSGQRGEIKDFMAVSDPQVNAVARTEGFKRWKCNSWSVFPQTFVPPSPFFNETTLSHFTKGWGYQFSSPKAKPQGLGTMMVVSPESALRGKLRKESWDSHPLLCRTLGSTDIDPPAQIPPSQPHGITGAHSQSMEIIQ